MFFVKASYRSETRKFSFPDSDSFPTYDQLYEQLYRVFPISHSYYLSRLLFSASSSDSSSRILIGMEAHDADQYEEHVRPFRGRAYPGGLLRFSVFDETPHKAPASPHTAAPLIDHNSDTASTRITVRVGGSHRHRPHHGSGHHSAHRPHVRFGPFPAPAPPPRPVLSRPPPPPLPPPRPTHRFLPPPPPPPIPSLLFAQQQSAGRRPLRPVASAPVLAQRGPLPPPPPPPPVLYTVPPPPSSIARTGFENIEDGKPSTMHSPLSETRRAYRRLMSHGSDRPSASPFRADLFDFDAYHDRINDNLPRTFTTNGATAPPPTSPLPIPASQKGKGKATEPAPGCCHTAQVKADVADLILRFKADLERVLVSAFGADYHLRGEDLLSNLDVPNVSVRVEPPESRFAQSELSGSLEPTVHERENRGEEKEAQQEDVVMRIVESKPEKEKKKIVHENIICDACEKTMEGVRHKCLDCPDYDLCTSCLDAPTRTHPREHQFFAIEEPGGVYVHTVFSSNDPSQEELATQVRNVQDLVASQVRTAIDAAAAAIQAGERAVAANENATREAREAMGASLGALHPPHVPFYPPPPPPVVPSSQAPVVQAVPALVAHNATCDMCDSRIEGDRYKCTDCPDYDTCSSCFTLVPSQHPSHTFVRLSVADLLIQPAPSRLLSAHPKYADSPTHHATCDACRRSIRGVRFKCMHPACADFDLCADCESLPLAVHPREHPLLKIRTPGGYVPRVWRYCAGSEADVLREVAREEVEKKREKESQFEEVLKKMDQEDQVPAAQQLEQADADKQESAPLVVDDVLMRLTRMFSEQTDPSTPLPLPAFGQTHATDDQRQNNTPTPRPAHVSPPPPVSVQMRPSVSYGVPIPVPVSIPAFPTPVVRPVSVSSSPPTTQSVAPMTFPAAQSSPPPRNPFLGVFAGPPQIPPFASVFPPEPRHTFPPATVRTPTLPPPPPSWLDMVRSPPQSPSRPVAPAAVTPPFIASPPPQLSLDLAPFEAPELEEEVQMPGQYDPLPIMVRRWSPEPLIQFEDKPVKVQASDNDNGEDADTRETSTLRDDASESDMSTLPRVRPTDFNELFDLAAQFRHLLELPSVPKHIPQSTANATVESEGDVASVVTPTELTSTVEGQESSKVPSQSAASTQGLEAASSTRGLPAPKAPFVQSKPNSIQSLIDTLRITSPRALEEILSGASVSSSTPEAAEADALLRATFVEDNNIPDGQIFPPGAEFVKSWRMRNDGLGAWPAGTEVVYVAGDKLMLDKRERFSVGSVAPGEEVDVWTGELKAPDVPGKYISYWRLNDPGRGRFGHSIWIDITVAEASNVQRTDDSDSSLAASSVIMPAQPASSVAAESAPAAQPDEATTAPLSPALTQVSTTSSVSLIDMPSDASDEESDVFEDSRSNVGSSPMANANLSPDIEYVVLYDSSDEE